MLPIPNPERGHHPEQLCIKNEGRNLLTYIFLPRNICVPAGCHLIPDEMM